jgi:rRNA maturation endonuclease Nob1
MNNPYMKTCANCKLEYEFELPVCPECGAELVMNNPNPDRLMQAMRHAPGKK